MLNIIIEIVLIIFLFEQDKYIGVRYDKYTKVAFDAVVDLETAIKIQANNCIYVSEPFDRIELKLI